MKKSYLFGFVIFFAMAGPVFSVVEWWDVEILPERPYLSDVVSITVSGDWPDSCIPDESAILVDNNDIYFDVIQLDPGGWCLYVPGYFKYTQTIGPLAPGKYSLYVRLVGEPHIPEEYVLMDRFVVSSGPVVFYVDAADGDDLNFADAPETALATIQRAIDKSRDGDTVIVLPGTYTGQGNRNLDFHGKAITVKSENGPENCIIDCNGTESETHRGFYFHSGEDTNSIVDGFTIKNGQAMLGYDNMCMGGGIYCEESSPKIINCNFSGNSAGFGGGMSIYIGNPAITNCTFSGNSAYEGGGIYNDDGNPTITNCTFSGNLAYEFGGGMSSRGWADNVTINNCEFSENRVTGGDGGGLFAPDKGLITNCTFNKNSANGNGGGMVIREGELTIINCIFSKNSANGDGGGMYNNYSNPTITNCIFSENRAYGKGGGIYYDTIFWSLFISNCTFSGNVAESYGGAICSLYSWEVEITNCIFYDDKALYGNELALSYFEEINIDYSNIEGGQANIYLEPDYTLNWLQGNIDAAPCFVDLGYWDPNGTPADANDDIWINGDYHLLPASPCIDAGDPNYVPGPNETDLDGNPRINGFRMADMQYGPSRFVLAIRQSIKFYFRSDTIHACPASKKNILFVSFVI